MVKNSKKMLTLTTLLSLFAVAVAGVSTFAWFNANDVSVPSVTNSSLVQSDSSNLVINDVTGYKFKYNDVSYGITDYEHGEPVSYVAGSVGNVDQADRKELDYPTKGEGYYIVGNSSWVANYNTETGESQASSTAWSYTSGLRLDDDLVDGNNNIATYNSVFLSAGTEFRLRHHYLTVTSDQTQAESYNNSWVASVLDTTTQTTTAAQINGDNIKIKAGRSGYYNIYFTNEQKVSFYLLELRANPRSIKPHTSRQTSSTEYGIELFGVGEKMYNDTSDTNLKKAASAFSKIKITAISYASGYNENDLFAWFSRTDNTYNYYPLFDINKANSTIYVGNSYEGSKGRHYSFGFDGYYRLFVFPPFVSSITFKFYYDANQIDSLGGAESSEYSITRSDSNNRHIYAFWHNSGTNCGYYEGGGTTATNGQTFYKQSIKYYERDKSTEIDTQTRYRYSTFVVPDSVETYETSLGDTFLGWYSDSSLTSEASITAGSRYDVGSEDKTYYPKVGYYMHKRRMYFAKDGSGNYSQIPGLTGYDDIESVVCSSTSSTAIPSSPGATTKKSDTAGGAYAFAFDGWYIGDSSGCDFNTAYTSQTLTGNMYVYARMYYLESKYITLYVDIKSPKTTFSWSTPYANVWWSSSTNTESTTFNTASATGVALKKHYSDASTTIYTLTIPTSASFNLTKGSFSGTNQTGDISLTTNGCNGNSRTANDNSIILWDTASGGNVGWHWTIFHGDPLSNGYYLSGSSAFENGSGNIPWTFVDANKMSTTDLPLSVVAKYENRTLTAGMEFKIWHYSSSLGRDGEYAVLNSDSETTATLEINGSNIRVKANVSGSFDIYVTETTYKVMVKDRNAGSKLYVQYGSSTTLGPYTMGKTPDGSSYLATYEQGIQITNAMIASASGGAYIGIVRQFAGQKTGYGTVIDGGYSFVSGSASKTFDGKSFTCLKINKAGFYSIYLKSNGKIMITSRPYLVNGSDVKTDGGDNGYYLIPYDTTYGNGTYRNGLKMNVINGESATTAEGNKNIASYSRFTAAVGDKFMIKYFENNITKYSPVEIATDDTTTTCLTHEGSGIYRFKVAGVYNIFMYKTSTGRSISVAKDSLSDFSQLNSIPSSATTVSAVKSANTTLILDVTFTITTPANMAISLDSVISGAGLSDYIKYGIFVDSDYSGTSGANNTAKIYNFFRADAQYNNLKVMSSYASISASGTYANGQHHAYIVIDYNPNTVSTMPTYIRNNFYFVLKATQPADS